MWRKGDFWGENIFEGISSFWGKRLGCINHGTYAYRLVFIMLVTFTTFASIMTWKITPSTAAKIENFPKNKKLVVEKNVHNMKMTFWDNFAVHIRSLQMMKTGVVMFQAGGSQLAVWKKPTWQDARQKMPSTGTQKLFENIEILLKRN